MLAAVFALTTLMPAVPAAQGATCGQIVNAFNEATSGFHHDAEQAGIGFVNSEIFKDYNKTLKTLGSNSTQASVAIGLKEDFDKAKGMFDKAQSYHESLMDAYRCLAPGSACIENGLTGLREHFTDAMRQWFDKLSDVGGLNAVREKVLEAANLIQRYTDRVLKITTDTMTAMQECTVPMRGQPRLDANSVPPSARVDADGLPEVAEPPSKPVTGSGGASTPAATTGGGSHIGAIIAVVGAGIGGGIAYTEYKKTQDENAALLNDIANLPTGSTGTTSGTGTSTGATGAARFNGTYDFTFIRSGPGGVDTPVNVSQYLTISNGSLTTSDRTISGTIDANGNLVNGTGVCPINESGADWTGQFSTNGTGSGRYTCRFGGISRTWSATRR